MKKHVKGLLVCDIPLISSSPFLLLSKNARLLYFYVAAYADDDGICDVGIPLMLSGAAKEDLQELISKGFLKTLVEPAMVYITDNLMNKRNLPVSKKHDSPLLDKLASVYPGTIIQVNANGKKVKLPVIDYLTNKKAPEAVDFQSKNDSKKKNKKKKPRQR